MIRATLIFLITMLMTTGQAWAAPTLKIGFVPWENAQELKKGAQLFADKLGHALKMKVTPFVAMDYSAVIEALRSGKIDLAFLPPAATVLAEKEGNGRILLKSLSDGKAQYYSAIITRVESPIKEMADLKDKRFAFVDPASASGAVFPKVMMMNAGLKPETDFKQVIYAGSHDAVVMAVYYGKVDAGATFCSEPNPTGRNSSWGRALNEKANEIRVVAYSKPLPSDSITVRRNMDPKLMAKIRQFFMTWGNSPEGVTAIRKTYGVTKFNGFATVGPKDYEPVQEAFEKVGLKLK